MSNIRAGQLKEEHMQPDERTCAVWERSMRVEAERCSSVSLLSLIAATSHTRIVLSVSAAIICTTNVLQTLKLH